MKDGRREERSDRTVDMGVYVYVFTKTTTTDRVAGHNTPYDRSQRQQS